MQTMNQTKQLYNYFCKPLHSDWFEYTCIWNSIRFLSFYANKSISAVSNGKQYESLLHLVILVQKLRCTYNYMYIVGWAK